MPPSHGFNIKMGSKRKMNYPWQSHFGKGHAKPSSQPIMVFVGAASQRLGLPVRPPVRLPIKLLNDGMPKEKYPHELERVYTRFLLTYLLN